MKTMRSIDGKRVFRVSDEKASQLYQDGEANYVPKEEWKEEVRDVNESTEKVTSTKKKSNKPSKAHKRYMRKTL